jgi:membrane protease YdiL (CAAX protease family)
MLELFRSLSQKDIYTFLMVCICGPIFEELLFRGVVLNGFLKLFNPWKAIILSSVFFGLFHLNPWQFVPAFLIGMLIGYVYWKSASLLPCIFIHWINNTAYWLLNALMSREIMSLADLFTNRLWYYLSVACSLILLLASLYLLHAFIVKHPLREIPAGNKT